MSYPKKSLPSKKTPNSQSNSRLPEDKKEKLLAIHQREQLKGLLVSKFLEKYGNTKGLNSDAINKEVADFIKSQPLTEENLRKLEQKIRDGQSNKPGNIDVAAANNQAQSNLLGGSSLTTPHQGPIKSIASVQHLKTAPNDDALSVTSSQRPRSVYQLGDEDDEWAIMMKYDAELHKKEKEIEKLRELDQRKKMKVELDKQLEEKNKVKQWEKQDLSQYMNVVHKQLDQYDNKEKKKEEDHHQKVMSEKYSRDKQLLDEYTRKKIEKKTEKELDSILVKKIQNEIENEIRTAAEKRKEQKVQLRQVLQDNEERRIRLLAEAQRQKEEDTKAQQEYTRLIEKQEAARAAELKAREDRAKKFMNLMADTIIKDQKAQMLEEERKLLQHTLDREAKEIADEKARQQRLQEQKKEIRSFLDSQLAEKRRREEEEQKLEKVQAQIWKKDTDDYFEHEKNKAAKLKEVNVQQAEFLKRQMDLNGGKGKKMAAHELLLNKQKLKEIAEKSESLNFQKAQLPSGTK